jgi:photosystem II stability/assembly factor-like uncharacterized protein
MKNILLLTFCICYYYNSLAQQSELFKKMTTSSSFFDFVNEYSNQNTESEDTPTASEYRKMHKFLWYWTTRVDSTGKYNVASEKMLEHLSSQINNPSNTQSSSSNLWESLGPTHAKGLLKENGSLHTEGDIGRIQCLWANPTNPNIILAASSTGGIWKTTNGGTNWNCLTDHLPGMGATDFAVNPSNHNIIYAVSGIHGNGVIDARYGYGIIKSTDGGVTWNLLNTGIAPEHKVYMAKIVIHPTDFNKLYAVSEKKIYYTTNGGSSWVDLNLTANSNQKFLDIGINKNNPNILFISGDNSFYKTTDGGINWIDIRGTNFNSANFRIEFSLARDSIYVLYWDRTNTSFSKIMKSRANQNNWLNVNINGVNNAIQRLESLEIEVSENGNIYIGGVLLSKSVNFGKTFINQSNIHPDIRDIIFPNGVNDNIVYIAHDGGISKNDPNVNNRMVNINGDLAVNQFYSIGITEQNPDFMIGGAHDCGSLKRYPNGAWKRTYTSDGGTTVVDPLNSNIVYAIFSGGGVGTFNKSLDAGESFISRGLYSWTSSTPIYINPINTNIIYASELQNGNASRIKKSLNKGETFTNYIHGENFNDYNKITEMTGSLSHPNYMYFSAYNSNTREDGTCQECQTPYLKKTTDGGVTWTTCTSLSLKEVITGIHVHSTNPEKIWISVGGFNSTKKVFTSNNGGTTWENLTNNLPNIPAQCIIYDELYQRTIVGTDAGVYFKYDNETNWQYFNNIPKTIIAELKLNRKNGDLVAATYGRGIWRTNIPGYCNSTTNLTITNNTNWNTKQTICSNVIVQNNSILNVSANTVLSSQAKITVKNGSKLIVTTNGIITNADIIIENGGHLIIENNGVLELNTNDKLDIQPQAIFDYSRGEIKIITK